MRGRTGLDGHPRRVVEEISPSAPKDKVIRRQSRHSIATLLPLISISCLFFSCFAILRLLRCSSGTPASRNTERIETCSAQKTRHSKLNDHIPWAEYVSVFNSLFSSSRFCAWGEIKIESGEAEGDEEAYTRVLVLPGNNNPLADLNKKLYGFQCLQLLPYCDFYMSFHSGSSIALKRNIGTKWWQMSMETWINVQCIHNVSISLSLCLGYCKAYLFNTLPT